MNRKIPELKPLFIQRMQALLPDKKDFKSYLDILKVLPVKSIRCNTLKISPDELKKKLEAKGWKIRQPWLKNPEVMIIEGKILKKASSQTSSRLSAKKSIIEKSHNNLDISYSTQQQSRESRFSVSSIDDTTFGSSDLSLTTSTSEASQSKNMGKGGEVIDLEPGELGRSLEHLLGYYYIQELASMLPIIALNSKPGERILDLCSAPGSKTTQAAAEMENKGLIIANEVSLGRIKILASNLERCGVTNTIITRKEGAALCKRLKKQGMQFDKILVDAPCSGEGTLRSSPKTYVMWNIKTIKNLPKIQKQLFASAIEILKPGGTLVYSTCTHAPEENEGVIDAILKEFPKLKIKKIKLPIKTREGVTEWASDFARSHQHRNERGRELDKTFSNEVKKCARVYPQDNDTEGFFIAKFLKDNITKT
ncbi:MAG: RsmB/NOP family class I SAM-dependent RNA methyltransferase [archaeon]